VRDIDRNLRRTFVYHIPLVVPSSIGDESLKDVNSLTMPPYELPSSIKYILPSPSGNKIAKLIEEDIPNSTADNKKRQVIEIWTHGGMLLHKRCILSDKIHGKVYTEKSKFGGMSWRPDDEDALVYVAESISPTTKSFFDRSLVGDSSIEGDEAATSSVPNGAQFTLGVGVKENWGEKYKDVSSPELFILSTKTGKVASITNVPCGTQPNTPQKGETAMQFAFGQPVFSPCGKHVIYTAWPVGPRRLGAIYCFQRPSKIYSSKVETLLSYLAEGNNESVSPQNDLDYICITENDRLARSPRVELLTNKIAFLCNSRGFDSHNGCMGLDIIEWDATNSRPLLETRRTIVKPVSMPKRDVVADEASFGLSFPGLFLDYLPDECFSADGNYIYCDSQWGSTTCVLKISVQDGFVEPLVGPNYSSTGADYGGSQNFLGAFMDMIILFHNSPINPGSILAFSKSGKVIRQLFTMHPIAVTSFSPVPYPLLTEAIQWKIVHANPSDGDPNDIIQSILLTPRRSDGDPNDIIQSILLTPRRSDGTKPPLIVVPHGGPHSCSSATFMPSYLFLCMQGKYAVLLVNYRGSTGFGQGSIEALLGKISQLDVQDLLLATKSVLKEGEFDESRVGICGGSHGGFLAGHMISQYPDLFKVAAMRNPVTNIASLVTASDIPDWCYVESLGAGRYDWTVFRPPLKTEMDSMYSVSPIANIQSVKAPTLIALGMVDRRVPPSQGLEYYYALRSKGISTKLLVYKDDDHAIDSPVSEADHWINIKKWFDDHL
jgi:acylaminoacyl-peptidase